ncbi:hypothetical protein QE152_g25439 [Popillia japonica]|uniref:Uncharacterized protein n=1 Tax=Popillia japonica TaxID=7064 RepID=A0AAW1K0H5_POPJA
MVEWNFIENESNLNICYRKFIGALSSVIDESCPKKIYNISSRSKKNEWITDEIKYKCKIKRQLYEDMLNDRVTKDEYGNKPKATWDLVRKVTGKEKKGCYNVSNIETSNEGGSKKGCYNVSNIETSNEGGSQAGKLDYINEYLINICSDAVNGAPINMEAVAGPLVTRLMGHR